jgi:hypothetical protein
MRTRLFKELADHLAAYTAMEDQTAKRRTLCSLH